VLVIYFEQRLNKKLYIILMLFLINML